MVINSGQTYAKAVDWVAQNSLRAVLQPYHLINFSLIFPFSTISRVLTPLKLTFGPSAQHNWINGLIADMANFLWSHRVPYIRLYRVFRFTNLLLLWHMGNEEIDEEEADYWSGGRDEGGLLFAERKCNRWFYEMNQLCKITESDECRLFRKSLLVALTEGGSTSDQIIISVPYLHQRVPVRFNVSLSDYSQN